MKLKIIAGLIAIGILIFFGSSWLWPPSDETKMDAPSSEILKNGNINPSVIPEHSSGLAKPAVSVVEFETNQPAAFTAEVKIDNFAFVPKELRVKAGTKVIWTNTDLIPHTIESDAGVFASNGSMFKDNTFEYIIREKGVFFYHCGHHPFMKASVIVE